MLSSTNVNEKSYLSSPHSLSDILKDNPRLHEITLNLSLYGKLFNLHIGFKSQSDEQEIDRIRFTPMKYTI